MIAMSGKEKEPQRAPKHPEQIAHPTRLGTTTSFSPSNSSLFTREQTANMSQCDFNILFVLDALQEDYGTNYPPVIAEEILFEDPHAFTQRIWRILSLLIHGTEAKKIP